MSSDPIPQTLLHRLLTHTTTWSTTQDLSTTLFDSLTNLHSQRDDTLIYHPTTTSQILHPKTTPAIILEFPDLIPKLLAKQTRAIESTLRKLHSTLDDFAKVVKGLEALEKDALYKLSSSQAQPPSQILPSHITLVEACTYISTLTQMYRLEYLAKKAMLDTLDLRPEGGNLNEVWNRWGGQYHVDLERETEIRERVALMKSMERIVGG